MPLLDDLLGPERVLPARQQEQLAQEQQAAVTGVSVDQVDRTRRERDEPATNPFSSLLSEVLKTTTTSPLQQLASAAVSAPTPTDAAAALTPGVNPASSIIGKKNYLVGKGNPSLRTQAQSVAASMGWDANQFAAWDALINAESGWNPNAQNPTSTAFGLGQFLDSTWKGYGAKTPDPGTQLAYMARYIKDRYGSPQKALEFHQSKNYY